MSDMGPTRDDSPDLTDIEVTEALVSSTPSDLVASLNGRSCPICKTVTQPTKQELRRRKPSLYMRVTLECPEGHPATKRLYRLDWMQDST